MSEQAVKSLFESHRVEKISCAQKSTRDSLFHVQKVTKCKKSGQTHDHHCHLFHIVSAFLHEIIATLKSNEQTSK